MENNSEVDRIKAVYERRKRKIPPQTYSFFNEANLFIVQRRDWMILETLKKYGITSLKEKKILDVGCGEGGELRNLIRFGARPENLFGIDLLPERIEKAKEISPNIDFRCGDASHMQYGDSTFDIVTQFTVFTSILDDSMKKNIAVEMMRVLKFDGIILWYDYYRDNPKNKGVRGVKKREILELFQGSHIYLKPITLAPPLTRLLAPHTPILCVILEKAPFLCTHYLGIIKKTHKLSAALV